MASLRSHDHARGSLGHWAPSWASLVVGLTLAVVAAATYVVAWHSSAFSIRHIEVEGISGAMADRVRTTLRPLEGSSLVRFNGADGRRLVAPVPFVASVSFDREFPDTLRATVVPEQPAALLRRGRDIWVVARSGRVLKRVESGPPPALPRIWLSAASEPIVGAVISDPDSAEAVRALTPMADVRLPADIRSVHVEGGEVSVLLSTGTRVLLGTPSQLRLKLTVVARILPFAGDAEIIDASVPDRVVAGSAAITDSQVDG